jgi:outer membrane protein assembly factor BamB
VLTASLTDAGGFVALSSQFVPDPARAAATGPARRRTIDATPKVNARGAGSAAFESIGESVTPQAFSVRPSARREWAESQELIVAGRAPTTAELTWLPMGPESLRLCWRIILHSARGELFQVVVDANTGEPLVRHSWSHGIAPGVFHVFAGESPSPFFPGYAQSTATNQPLDLTTPGPEFTNQVDMAFTTNAASPAGWIHDSAAFNFQHTTVGNNVDAHLDLVNANPGYDDPIATPPQARPPGTVSNGVVHLRHVADLSQAPMGSTNTPATANQRAAVVNAFYWANWMHDRLWELGFTESAGNFQHDNFGRGGVGGDAVLIDVQNSAGLGIRNIGFFTATPTDGTSARISLGIWDGPNPEREGAFDALVLLHEYVHLVVTRRVGHGIGLSTDESLGLAEGWSDFIPLCLFSRAGQDFGAAYPYGAFSTYLWNIAPSPFTQNYHYGMRRYPYSTNLAINPLTFNDLDALDATGHLAVAVSPVFTPYEPLIYAFEPHNIGELWSVTLWDLFASLVQKNGFDAGRELLLTLVLDGMALCPPNPGLLQARDALILADHAMTGGANWNEIWRAFARRGMGWSAPEPVNVGIWRITPAFDMPPSGQMMPGWPFVAKNAVRSSPAIAGNDVLVGSNDGRLYSLSDVGVTNWTFFPKGKSPFVSSASIAPDGIVVKRKNGWVYKLDAGGNLQWSNQLASTSKASAAISTDGGIYIAGNRDLTALNSNGAPQWQFFAGKTIQSSPSIGTDGTVYFGSDDGRLYALNPATGTVRPGWPFNAGKPIRSSPAIASDGAVFFGCQNKRIYALNGATGAKLWEFATGGPVESSPALDTNNTVYVGSDDRRVYALRASDGQLKWSFRAGGAIRSSPAISADRIVYVGANDGYVYALASVSGQLIYRVKLGGTIQSSPGIAAGGSIYVGSSNGKVAALRGTAGPADSRWPMFRREARRLGNVDLP